MHHLYIKNVGPIKECKIDIENFSVFTGAQASGKSTIAKAIYFFRTIKEDILDIILRSHSLSNEISLYNAVLRRIRDKFLQIFGSSRAMSNDMLMCYNYNENTHVEITLRLNKGDDYISPNFVFFNFSSNINEFLRRDIFASVFEEPSRESLKNNWMICFPMITKLFLYRQEEV